MNIKINKDTNRQYITMEGISETDLESYPVRMLTGGSVEDLLPCQIYYTDGEPSFSYDTTGCQSFGERYKTDKISGEHMRKLLEELIDVLETMARYLLNEKDLILQADTIYFRSEGRTGYICLPGYDKDIREQIKELLEYALPILDHSCMEDVTLAYDIYRCVMGEDFHLDVLKELLARTGDKKEEQKDLWQEDGSKADAEERRRMEAMDAFFSEEEKEEKPQMRIEKIPWELIFTSVAWAVVLAGISILRVWGYLSFLTLPMIAGIFAITLGIIGLHLYLYRQRNLAEDSYVSPFGDRSMAQGSIQLPVREEESSVPSDLSSTQPLPTIPDTEGGMLVSEHPEKYPNIPFQDDLMIVGKMAPAAGAVISCNTVSRIHAKIRRAGKEYYVMDLGSANGTYVNGEPLEARENRQLAPGDQITFADVSYTLMI